MNTLPEPPFPRVSNRPMKERYFTRETINKRASVLLRATDGYRREPPAEVPANETSLLVLDMQRYFLAEDSHAFIPSAPAIIPQVNELVNVFNDVILTRHLNADKDAGMLAGWWRDLIKADDPLSELDPRLDSSKGRVIVKTQYDAFYGTELEKLLRDSGTRSLVVCGVMTHLCCETTARSAFMRGFQVIFPVDATATYTEELHRATLLTLSHGFAIPLLTEELVRLVERER